MNELSQPLINHDTTEYNTYRAFGIDSQGDLKYFFPNGTFSYHKLNWYEPLAFQKFWIGSIVIVFLISLLVSILRLIFFRSAKSYAIQKINSFVALLILLFLGLTAYGLSTIDPQEIVYGLPTLNKISLIIPFILIPLVLYSIFALISSWISREFSTRSLVYHSILVFAAVSFIPWLWYWNLIGFNY